MNPRDTICTSLAASPVILDAFVADIPQDQLDIRRRAGFWSLRDHITHLADVQPMLYSRIVLFRDNESPQIAPYFPDKEGEAASAGSASTLPPAGTAPSNVEAPQGIGAATPESKAPPAQQVPGASDGTPDHGSFEHGAAGEPVVPAEESLGRFALWRSRQVELIRSLPEEAWARCGAHPEYQQYTLDILIRHILMHDHWHMYRMEELWLTNDAYLTALE